MRRLALWLLITTAILISSLNAQTISQYRIFWVDIFNTPLFSHNDVVTLVNNAKAAKANAVLVQVRRRGDAFYISNLRPAEPRPDFTAFNPSDFDALADVITTAHAAGIEVHAFVICADIWSKNPTFAPSSTLGPPTNPNHVFNRHGGYDSVSKTIIPGPNNWLTRTLLPDSPPPPAAQNISFQGHRFGSDFWLDFGHPDAAAYTYDVLMEIVRKYDIDGLHLDRIRYPDISVSGQTPSTGTNIGYNPTNVARFQQHYGIPVGSAAPAPNDPRWSQWRRDQVTALVRRVYLNAIAIKPQIKISAALIAFGGGPTTEAAWANAEAYWRVYQDWRAWTEEGILDMALPMAYKREHTSAEATQYNQWSEWTKNHQYNRAGVMAVGGLVNAIEGSLRQTRRALAPSSTGNKVAGVVFYSMATSNVAETANPYSIPAGQNTPLRPFGEFASGLTTGRSANGAAAYEDLFANPVPIFATDATVPVLTWKASPARGHLMGFAKRPNASPVDTGAVTIQNLDDGAVKTTSTDGNGFFGAVDLNPGHYLVKVQSDAGEVFYSCIATVSAGLVANADAGFDPPPQISAPPDRITSTDAGACSATVDAGTATANDNCGGTVVSSVRSDGARIDAPYPKGITTITWKVIDAAGQTASATQKITVNDVESPHLTAPADIDAPNDRGVCSANLKVGKATATDNCAVASVQGVRSDALALDAPYPKGLTTITWTATDSSGLTTTANQTIAVHDSEPPSITNVKTSDRELWPANHKMIDVKVSYNTTDNCSPVVTTLSVTSSESEDGLGDGDTAPDFVVINNHEVSLRAERSALGNGRVYTITITAVDADGNTSTASTTVSVPLNQGH